MSDGMFIWVPSLKDNNEIICPFLIVSAKPLQSIDMAIIKGG